MLRPKKAKLWTRLALFVSVLFCIAALARAADDADSLHWCPPESFVNKRCFKLLFT